MSLPELPAGLATPAQARAFRDALEAQGRRLVFTNGVFDVLHVGHVRYLTQARALGDALIVGLNSDASVRALKGPRRPVNTAAERAEVLRGLRAVDGVVLFEGERCTSLIEALRPHLYAKGGDYTIDSLNREERAALEAVGAEIHILPLVKGKSTTATLAQLHLSMSDAAPVRRLPRIAVLGSGRGSNFAAILQAIERKEVSLEVALVISDNPEAGILQIAREAGLPAQYVNPGPWKTKLDDAAQKEICDRLRAAEVDLVVLAGFMRRIKEPILSTFPDRILNIHPSLLPAFPGREAWKQALAAGVTETGCTVHVVDAGIDTGRILAQSRVPVLPGDDETSLFARINQAEHALYPRTIAVYAETLFAKES